jgi:hypothetical protein
MTRVSRFYWLRHCLSLLVLLAVDMHRRSRRLVTLSALRVLAGLLGLLLFTMVISSLYALRQVTRSVESLIGDSMVGLESSVAMRAAVRETQLDLLRLQLMRDRRLQAAEVDALKVKVRGLLRDYRSGVFEPEDEINAERIEARLDNYLQALQSFVDVHQPLSENIAVADEAARRLVEAVETAYQFNRRRIHASADEAASVAQQALGVSNRLGWSLAAFIAFGIIAYGAFRWLAPPTDID